MAEGDRDAYRRQQAALAREKEIMKDVKGWVVCTLCYLLRSGVRLISFDRSLASARHSTRYLISSLGQVCTTIPNITRRRLSSYDGISYPDVTIDIVVNHIPHALPSLNSF